jgi:hypothetical protein
MCAQRKLRQRSSAPPRIYSAPNDAPPRQISSVRRRESAESPMVRTTSRIFRIFRVILLFNSCSPTPLKTAELGASHSFSQSLGIRMHCSVMGISGFFFCNVTYRRTCKPPRVEKGQGTPPESCAGKPTGNFGFNTKKSSLAFESVLCRRYLL